VENSEFYLQERLTNELLTSDGIRDVLRAAGQWMAFRLSHRDFVWKQGRGCLEASIERRLERITLQGSRYNRAGRFVQVAVARLTVFDKTLEEWRRENPELTVARDESLAGIVCSTSYFDISRNSQAVLTVPDKRVRELQELCGDIEEIAFPWFDTTRVVEELPNAVPDALLRPTAFAQDLLEFLYSRGHADAAIMLIRRFAALSAGHEAAFRDGAHMAMVGARPAWHSASAFGWSSHVLGLV
jgi:hypothetical protein